MLYSNSNTSCGNTMQVTRSGTCSITRNIIYEWGCSNSLVFDSDSVVIVYLGIIFLI